MTPQKSIVEEYLGYELPDFEFIDPTIKPDFFWIKSESKEIVKQNGRRKSPELCVNQIRDVVDEWRTNGYPGASKTTSDLFHWWFEESRHVLAFGLYRPYWVQREAIETIVYLLEIQNSPDASTLINTFGKWVTNDLLEETFTIQKNMDQIPQIILPNNGKPIDLPQDDLPRYAIKAATGSGKTMVMSYLIFWSMMHSMREQNSQMANNFLLLSPNVIVFERLKKDFVGGKIFKDLDMCPAGWANPLQVILRGESIEPSGKNTLVVTNIQQLHENRSEWVPKNALDKILGKAPVKGAKNERHILDRIRGMKNLMVLNDEAHHTHDDDLKWNQILLDLHRRAPLKAWLDFSATPKMQNGTTFPWVVTDYPLAQAVEHQIVKFPIIVKSEGKKFENPDSVTSKNAVEKYGSWVSLGVDRLRAHQVKYEGNPSSKPVMFIMCEDVKSAEAIGAWLSDKRSKFGFKEEEILVIHTKGDGAKGETISESDLEKLRNQANVIDSPASPVKVVVSVLVLREGWDVRNVSIVLGLRPGNAKSGILPEQAIGRGLRLMSSVAGTQVLEILGTPAFQEIVHGLEDEGVLVGVTTKVTKSGRMISPIHSRKKFDISIPRTSTTIMQNYSKIEEFDPLTLPPCYTSEEFKAGTQKARIKFEALHGPQNLGKIDVINSNPLLISDSLGFITGMMTEKAHLTQNFATYFPIVRKYVLNRCHSEVISPDSVELAIFLSDVLHREKIANLLGKELAKLITTNIPIEIKGKPLQLSEIKPFMWNRNVRECKKTIFNFVPVWNDFEGAFADFLDHASDVSSFSALAEYNTEFYVNYQKPSGALGQYFPDWVVRTGEGKTAKYWIIETKGRAWEGTLEKDAAVEYWCEQVSLTSGSQWSYFRVNQDFWNKHSFGTLTALVKTVNDHKHANLALN